MSKQTNTKALQDLTKSIQDLSSKTFSRAYIAKQNKHFRTIEKIAKIMEECSKTMCGGGGGGGGGAGGSGGGGSGGAGGGGPGDNGTDSRNLVAALGLAKFASGAIGKIVTQIRLIDDLQARAMASNTLLQQMDIPRLGVSFAQVAEEILDLREVGFKNLNYSTLGLISTMKMTNQSTKSLQQFLAKTSLSLVKNTEQIQNLAIDLQRTSRMYGMTQETMFDIANKLSDVVQVPTLFGKGAESLTALTSIAAKIGDRASEPLRIAADFLMGVGKENENLMAGTFSYMDKILFESAGNQEKLLLDAAKTYLANFENLTRGLAPTRAGVQDILRVAQQFGGLQTVNAMKQLVKALEDSSVATKANTQETTTLKTFFESYLGGLQRISEFLETIVNAIPKPVAQAAGIAAAAATPALAAAGAMALAKKVLTSMGTRALAGAAAGAATGPAAPWVAPVLAIGGAIWGVYDIIAEVADSSKVTAESTKALADAQKAGTDTQAKTAIGLFDTINSMIMGLGPGADITSRDALELQKESLKYLADIANGINKVGGKQMPGFYYQPR